MRNRMIPLTRRKLLLSLSAAAVAPTLARAQNPEGGAEYFELTRFEVKLPGLDPAHDGLVLAQLTDLHIGHDVPDGRVISAVRTVNDLKPDLVALTGDFVTTKKDNYDRVPQLLSALNAPAFAVLGNHDHWSDAHAIRSRLEGANVTVLQNAHTVTRLKGVAFSVVGIDDATAGKFDAPMAYQGQGGGSRLVLTHTPGVADKLPERQGDLVLSGHTHGGQWEIPGLTRGVFERVGHPWYRGLYEVNGNALYVNRGLGFGRGTRLPRLNSEPEVALITLRCAES
jgi:predicted MPP superfamily phosphohydrolase